MSNIIGEKKGLCAKGLDNLSENPQLLYYINNKVLIDFIH